MVSRVVLVLAFRSRSNYLMTS